MRTALFVLFILAMGLTAALPVAAQGAGDLIHDARRDIEAGRYQQAEEALRAALESATGDELSEARFRLATLQRDADEAGTLFRRIIDDEPGSDWARQASLELAKVQYALGNYGDAYNLLADSGACEVSEEACLFHGLSAIMLKRFDDARRPLERVRQGRLRTWAFMSLAEVDMGLDRKSEACDRYGSLSSALISPTAIYRHGECLEDSGDLEGAKDEYREIIRSFRDTPEAVLATEKLQRIARPERRETAPAEPAPDQEHEGVAHLDEGFTLQFGSFRDRGNAIKMAARIKREFPGARIDTELVNYREHHRVRYGYFRTRDEARAKGEEISRQTGEEFTIMTLP